MEVKEAEKIVIVKPVASRPSSSSFGSFSEILTRETNASPSNPCPAIAATAIRPKTLRFMPVLDHNSPQAEISEPASNVLCRPMAKRASVTTASILKNSGSSNLIYQREVAEIEGHVQQLKVVSPPPNLASEVYQSSQFRSEGKIPEKSSKLTSDNLEEDQKSSLQTNTVDRLAYDGYNWRKYGQKQVKGSEYPRSYYKCTHPNCPVKKNVERSLEGHIAEIVYKGEHNHPKPLPLQRGSSDRQGRGSVYDATGNETNNMPRHNQHRERNEGCTGKTENENEVGSSGHSSSTPSFYYPVMAGAFYTGANAAENSCGLSEECDAVSKNFEAEGDGHKGKRRRNINLIDEVETSEEGAKEPRIVVQNHSDSEVLGDGFHWRKYGQKVVKGNSYPRSYYRCTSADCNVRKYVERTSDEPGAFITTYEGRHNHDLPMKSRTAL